MGEPLELLLEKLAAGDPLAADQLLLVYEPYLRGVVRRQLPRRRHPPPSPDYFRP